MIPTYTASEHVCIIIIITRIYRVYIRVNWKLGKRVSSGRSLIIQIVYYFV